MTPARRIAAAAAGLALGCLAIGAPPRTSAQAPQPDRYMLRGESALLRAYDLILDARFDEAGQALEQACGPAPPEACQVLAAAAAWWQIHLDPDDHARDPAFVDTVERAIRNTHAWVDRAAEDPEAWFYLASAYGARVQWRVLRGERLAAARDGARIKDALERALVLEPRFDDAYFGLGLYKYYAAVAPAAARFLRALLRLPGGNRAEGLQDMLRARAHGRLLQGEADYQLHVIYLWYERDVPQAVARLQALEARYPGNPHFTIQLAHVRETYEHDIMASLGTWQRLIAAAESGRVNEPGLAATRARLGAAQVLETLHETDRAMAHLHAVVDARSERPLGSQALALLRLGMAHDRLGDRADAVAAYQAAIAAAPPRDPHHVRTLAARRLRRAPDAAAADASRLSLEGWRHLERGDAAAAVDRLRRAVALAPREPVARYRLGRALEARGAYPDALAELQQAMREARTCPAPILGEVYLNAGRIHERLGRRDDARAAYATAASLFGASAETRASAARALAGLTGEQETRK
jgi:tetratricopeptide (TPR) repeat protein